MTLQKLRRKLNTSLVYRVGRVKARLQAGARQYGGPVFRPPYPDTTTPRIHLGCGDVNRPEFINVDARYFPHIHHVSGVERLPFFADNFAGMIYVSHCLEHISWRCTLDVLREWLRVLSPGGTLRISVPDFDVIQKMYRENNCDIDAIVGPLLGGQEYSQNSHFAVFNEKKLTGDLRRAGFQRIRRWETGQDEYASIPDWSGRTVQANGKEYPISLNLEADK